MIIDKLFTKIKSLIKRAVISNPTDDSNIYCITNVNYYEKNSLVEMIFPYGMSANPPAGTIGLLFNINGHESNRAFIPYAVSNRFKDLEITGVIFGNPASQIYIIFGDNGNILIKSTKVIFKKGDIKIEEEATIDCIKINLGIGGNKIARLGDQITVNVGGTDYFGTITSAGINTSK